MEISRASNTIIVSGIQGDMGETETLELIQQEDGDVIVSIRSETGRSVSLEFCTSNGGGRHPVIAKKLRELIAGLLEE